ncbi:MAG: type I DNA topoisomerase [Mycoplasmataceae bacterium]|nr:type I DNA topoisomerase [Mycoplasmataceae bacterium]
MPNLVIVESPNKVNKIQKFLGKDYKVLATQGHVRDLMLNHEYRMGIDLSTMTPSYKIDKDKAIFVEDIKKAAKRAKVVYLATDPDREGESIAWHVKEAAEISDKKVVRITFNEITEKAVNEAIENVGEINMKLVNSQEARRMLDRMVGFRLSKLIREKVGAKSAGRVQSVALKIISDRENERSKFVKEEWKTLELNYTKENILKHIDSDKKEVKFSSEEDAKKIMTLLEKTFVLKDVTQRNVTIPRPKPLDMSSFLIGMYNTYGFTNARSSIVIQRLYEEGVVTYPRTDSNRISSLEFISEIKKYIFDKYGESNFKDQDVAKSKKAKENVEDAHEAIRPTSLAPLSDEVKKRLKPAELKAYKFIYERTLKCFMIPGTNIVKTNIFENNGYLFSISSSSKDVLGFREVDGEQKSKASVNIEKISSLKIEDKFNFDLSKMEITHHETKPPGKFNQATLIKKLKEEGIGRPSTYAPTTKILLDRVYILSESGVFTTTELGRKVNKVLGKAFPEIITENFTSGITKDFNEITRGRLDYKEFIKSFWNKFEPRVEDALENIPVQKIKPRLTGEKCPLDGGDLVARMGKYGEFYACNNFPKCRYIKGNEVENVGRQCPDCGKDLVYKKSKYGTKFVGCSGYPECKYMEKTEPKSKKKTNNKEKK